MAAAFDVTGAAPTSASASPSGAAGRGRAREVLVFDHDGRFVVVLRVRAVAGQSVADAHALAGRVEEAVRAAIDELEEVVVEVDP